MMDSDVDSALEVHGAFDFWRRRIFDTHVYARDGVRYQILARKVPATDRLLVALHDMNDNIAYATNLEAGSIQDLAATARAQVPPDTRFNINSSWRG